MRTSLHDAALRAQTNASRATLRELNSKPFWSEAKQVDVLPSETHSDVEFAENYGSTSVPAKQDKDEDQQQGQQQGQQGQGGEGGGGSEGEQGEQPKGDSAEAVVLYLNGSRSHPVIISMGDRRHRLMELEEGDVAQHRLKDDRQQFLLSADGTYISTRDDKKFRIALVPVKEQGRPKPGSGGQQQQAGGGGIGAEKTQKKQKKYGQTSAKDDNAKSDMSIEQNGKETKVQHGKYYSSQRKGSDSTIWYDSRDENSAQVTDEHTHIRNGKISIWVAKGCFSDMPIVVKKDNACKGD
jgi:phage gp45-like